MPTASTSAGTRTTISASGSARTSASAPTSRAWRSGSCSRSCSAACPTSSSPARRRGSAPTSSAASSTCPSASPPSDGRGARVRTRICDTFGIEFPIFAFSHCRDVVTAVSRAGGESPDAPWLAWTHTGARSQVEAALGHPIKLLVNALGTPPRDVVDKVHDRGVLVAALIGTAEHARRQVEAGVDIVIASGNEAGGHTGEIATLVLVPEVVDVVAPTPVLAAGGIGCGRQVAAALALGADGAWTGSIWLASTESDLHPVALQKVLKATSRDTVRSRSLTGKPARQLRTAWTDA